MTGICFTNNKSDHKLSKVLVEKLWETTEPQALIFHDFLYFIKNQVKDWYIRAS